MKFKVTLKMPYSKPCKTCKKRSYGEEVWFDITINTQTGENEVLA